MTQIKAGAVLAWKPCAVKPDATPATLFRRQRGRSAVRRRLSYALLVVLLLPTAWFALRSYGSFALLRSAYEAGAPRTSSIRAWMTFAYVADAYHVSASALIARVGVPPTATPDTSLRTAAEQAGLSPFQYVERVQRAVAALIGNAPANAAPERSGWFARLSDRVLSGLLVYGYPILGLSVLLGTLGLPLPQGLAATAAGSLAAQGRINWLAAAVVLVAASLLGDLVAYQIGRLARQDLLDRYGRWAGYTAERAARVSWLFARWGSLTVFLTRTFASYLGAIASVLAGASRYRLDRFLAIAALGRSLWAAAYLGLGYVVGSDLEAATGFLGNVSGLLLLLLALSVAAAVVLAPSPAAAAPVNSA